MSGMADSYKEQWNHSDYQGMTFEERFNLLVDREYSRRQSNKLQRLINQAQFSEPSAAIEDIEYHPDRHLDKHLILELATGNYIEKHLNINGMGFWTCSLSLLKCSSGSEPKLTVGKGSSKTVPFSSISSHVPSLVTKGTSTPLFFISLTSSFR